MKLPGISSLVHVSEIDSTQTAARALAEQGAADGTLVWADRQSRGRGRLSRSWDSAPGGLYFSLILRPGFSPSRLADFSLMAAKVAAEALAALSGAATNVKKPNDVMVRVKGKQKKICGILAEASGDAGGLHWLVIGVGVNVNNAPRLARAASLRAVTGKTWAPVDVLKKFLDAFAKEYGGFPEAKPGR